MPSPPSTLSRKKTRDICRTYEIDTPLTLIRQLNELVKGLKKDKIGKELPRKLLAYRNFLTDGIKKYRELAHSEIIDFGQLLEIAQEFKKNEEAFNDILQLMYLVRGVVEGTYKLEKNMQKFFRKIRLKEGGFDLDDFDSKVRPTLWYILTKLALSPDVGLPLHPLERDPRTACPWRNFIEIKKTLIKQGMIGKKGGKTWWWDKYALTQKGKEVYDELEAAGKRPRMYPVTALFPKK